MKIKTITCHDVYNYGASLQAYALQTYLSGQGHDVEIIDYKPGYLTGQFYLWGVTRKYNKPVIKYLYLAAMLPKKLYRRRKKDAFDEFTHEHLHLTKRYKSIDELRKDPPQADVYIAGSDQIWNTILVNGRDASFYLDFGDADIRRISYAASFSTSDVAEKWRPFVEEKLKRFDKISLREKTALPLLRSLGREDGVAVCDPVFLLTAEEWRSVEHKPHIKGRYIVVYDFDNSDVVKQIAQKISRKTHSKIVNISPNFLLYASKNMSKAGPLDFVGLIDSAEFVVSNSFHATAFSVILGKRFCVVNRKEGINERMKSMLDDFGLSNRLVSEYRDELLEKEDDKIVKEKLDAAINASKLFLDEAIGEKINR